MGIRTSAALSCDHVRYLTIDNRKQPGSQADLSDTMGTLWGILTGFLTVCYDGQLYQPTLQRNADFSSLTELVIRRDLNYWYSTTELPDAHLIIDFAPLVQLQNLRTLKIGRVIQ